MVDFRDPIHVVTIITKLIKFCKNGFVKNTSATNVLLAISTLDTFVYLNVLIGNLILDKVKWRLLLDLLRQH